MKHIKKGQTYNSVDGRSTEVYTVTKVDEDYNATWIEVTDSKGATLSYGKKAFKAKYQDAKDT